MGMRESIENWLQDLPEGATVTDKVDVSPRYMEVCELGSVCPKLIKEGFDVTIRLRTKEW